MTTNEATRKQSTSRIRAKVAAMRTMIGHASTSEEERAAAQRGLARLAQSYDLDGTTGVTTAERWLYNPGAWQGERYDSVKRMTLTEIAKLMREDYKLARKVGRRTAPKLGQAVPGEVAAFDPIGDAPAEIKVSIRTEYYSGGGAIRVMIKNVPQDWGWTDEIDRHNYSFKQATPAMEAFIGAVQEIHRAYNYDNSDAMTDHFDRNYWGTVDTEQRIHVPRVRY